MSRPVTIPDVFALVRRSRVVDDARLAAFQELLASTGMEPRPADSGGGITPPGILSLMIERGLLTRFQADELAAGRWWGLWVGPYRILDRLGRGGMGQVFLAEHGLIGKRVAVKVLAGALQADPAARTRFVREARAAAALDHPNVVRVFDGDAAHDPPFLVMEYIDGVSLQAAVARHGPFEPAEAAAVGVQAARGLHHAAAVGLIHRDIKPANLLLDRTGMVKILDLGIARFAGDPTSNVADGAMILGTLDYLAPEQAADSSQVDTRADLYSLGATLYFLLAGHPPYPDTDMSRKVSRKLETDPTPLRQVRPDVPDELAAAIHRLMARPPAARYQLPAEAVAALEPWANPGPDFPARFFRPVATDNPALETPTELGPDGDPTPVPATRRIIRPRSVPVPTPADLAREQSAVAAPARNPACGIAPDGDPTVRIGRPLANGSRGKKWWVVGGIVLIGLGALLALLLCIGMG